MPVHGDKGKNGKNTMRLDVPIMMHKLRLGVLLSLSIGYRTVLNII